MRELPVQEDVDLLRSDRVTPSVPFDDVRHADEAGDEFALGVLVHLRRRPDLLDPALVEDCDAIGHRQRLLLIVRHVDERDADLALDRLELDLHLLAKLEVERTERLVEEQYARLVHDRARERDALPLAPGELRRLAVSVRAEPHHLERLDRARIGARPS